MLTHYLDRAQVNFSVFFSDPLNDFSGNLFIEHNSPLNIHAGASMPYMQAKNTN
jgi:hypothetical protein